MMKKYNKITTNFNKHFYVKNVKIITNSNY